MFLNGVHIGNTHKCISTIVRLFEIRFLFKNFMINYSTTQSSKFVVMGNGAFDKNSMAIGYTTKKFYNYSENVMFDGTGLWDTAVQEELGGLRLLFYPGSDVILICFSIIDHSSYINVKDK